MLSSHYVRPPSPFTGLDRLQQVLCKLIARLVGFSPVPDIYINVLIPATKLGLAQTFLILPDPNIVHAADRNERVYHCYHLSRLCRKKRRAMYRPCKGGLDG